MPGSREEDFKRNNAFSLYDLYGHALAQEPLPWGHEIYNFCKPFLRHHYYIPSLSLPCPRVERNVFMNLTLFNLQLPPLGMRGATYYIWPFFSLKW